MTLIIVAKLYPQLAGNTQKPRFLGRTANKNEFDWWLFSKLDESLDEVYIPYYNPDTNRISYFYPDFIFWLRRGNNYSIVFIDPKGTKHTDYMHKVDGYKIKQHKSTFF